MRVVGAFRWLAVLAMVGGLGCGGGGDGRGRHVLAEDPDPRPIATLEETGLIAPTGIAFDSNGEMYVASTTGEITRIKPDGSRSLFVRTERALAGLAVGPQNELFAAAPETGEVLAITPDGAIRVATSQLDAPMDIVFDADRRAIVSAAGRRGAPQIAWIEFDTTHTTLTREIPSPAGMVFGPDEQLYVADTAMNRIVRMSLTQFGEIRTPEVYASGITRPTDLAFDEHGNLFVSGGERIWLVKPETAPDSAPYVIDGDIDGPQFIQFGIVRGPQTLFWTNHGAAPTREGRGTSVSSAFIGNEGFPLNAPFPIEQFADR